MKISEPEPIISALGQETRVAGITFPHRVGIIDIGSNSIKLRIYEIISADTQKVLYEDRDMIRLGEEVFVTQHLPASAFAKTVETLESYKRILEKFDTSEIVVKATSAVREAKNVNLFLSYIKKYTGISIQVLSGLEEAQYVYLAALSSLEFHNRTILLIDIGGGSTEVCIATQQALIFSESLPLGTVRLTQTFFADHNPLENYPREKVRTMEVYCQKQVKPLQVIFSRYQPEFILAFGGTPHHLAFVAQKHNIGIEKEGCLGIPYRHNRDLFDTFLRSSPEKIARIKGLEPKRADIVLSGSLILKTIADLSGNLDILTSPKGLREGIMMEYIFSRINPNIYEERQNDFRLKSAYILGEKFSVNRNHARQVEHLATKLFHQLKPLHHLDQSSLILLRAAAYLHDIGMIINYKDHHKHSQYIISQAMLSGFTQEEKEVIGLISRYHRKSNPKNSHTSYKNLPEIRKQEVAQLAAIIRLADALDQSYQENIQDVSCVFGKETITMTLQSKPGADLTLEKWGIQRKKAFAESLWDHVIHIQDESNKDSTRND